MIKYLSILSIQLLFSTNAESVDHEINLVWPQFFHDSTLTPLLLSVSIPLKFIHRPAPLQTLLGARPTCRAYN